MKKLEPRKIKKVPSCRVTARVSLSLPLPLLLPLPVLVTPERTSYGVHQLALGEAHDE